MINSKGFLGPEFSTLKETDTYRIFALGDSCTFSDGIWANSYPAIVERLLNNQHSTWRFEVINAGIEGYNTTYARNRLREEIISYQPDMVVIYLGWNDLMKSPSQSVSASTMSNLIARVREEFYLIKAFRKLIFYYLRPLIVKPDTGSSHDNGEAGFTAFVPSKFRTNLEAMLRFLRTNRVKILLLTLPTVVSADMTYREVKENNVFFPYYAGANSVPELLNLVHAYNRVILEVGHMYEVPVVDLYTTFNQLDKKNLFWDTMHPSYLGQQVVASSIFARIRQIQQDTTQCNLYHWDDLCAERAGLSAQ